MKDPSFGLAKPFGGGASNAHSFPEKRVFCIPGVGPYRGRVPSRRKQLRAQLDNSQKQRINESMDVFGRGCGVCGQLMEELSIRIHGAQLGVWIDGRFLVSALFCRPSLP